MNNPYSTPGASIDVDPRVATYQPRFLSLNGRIGRLRYFAYTLGLTMLMYVALAPLLVLTAKYGDASAPGGANMAVVVIASLLMLALYIVVLVMMVGFIVRRLNDLGKTGWLALLFLLPVANLVLWIYLQFFRGHEAPNQYGPAPVANSGGVVAVAIIGGVLFVVGMIGAMTMLSTPAFQGLFNQAGEMQQLQQQ